MDEALVGVEISHITEIFEEYIRFVHLFTYPVDHRFPVAH